LWQDVPWHFGQIARRLAFIIRSIVPSVVVMCCMVITLVRPKQLGCQAQSAWVRNGAA